MVMKSKRSMKKFKKGEIVVVSPRPGKIFGKVKSKFGKQYFVETVDLFSPRNIKSTKKPKKKRATPKRRKKRTTSSSFTFP